MHWNICWNNTRNYRKPFLSLIQSLPPAAQLDKCEVAREEKIGEDSRIDLVLSGNDWLVYIENKPWQQSNFGTTGEQLKRYAQHLAPRTPNNRILCLLTREDCKNKLLHTAASVEGITDTSNIQCALVSYYSKEYQIFLNIITWEEVLAAFDAVPTNDTIIKFLLRELRECLFPCDAVISSEDIKTKKDIDTNWDIITTKIKAINTAMLGKLKTHGYLICNNPRSDRADDASYFGWFVYDRVNGDICYWIGANRNIWEIFKKHENPKDYLFIIKVSLGEYNKLKKGGSKIERHILDDSDFSRVPGIKSTYVFPLIDSTNTDTIDTETLANNAMNALNKVRDTLAKYG